MGIRTLNSKKGSDAYSQPKNESKAPSISHDSPVSGISFYFKGTYASLLRYLLAFSRIDYHSPIGRGRVAIPKTPIVREIAKEQKFTPRDGIEPSAKRLTVVRSTAELPGIIKYRSIQHPRLGLSTH